MLSFNGNITLRLHTFIEFNYVSSYENVLAYLSFNLYVLVLNKYNMSLFYAYNIYCDHRQVFT